MKEIDPPARCDACGMGELGLVKHENASGRCGKNSGHSASIFGRFPRERYFGEFVCGRGGSQAGGERGAGYGFAAVSSAVRRIVFPWRRG